jgi:uncharacterized membrane protein YsdA (DUF1294 family)
MQPSRKQKKSEWRTVAGVIFLGALLAGWGAGRVPLPVVVVYGVMSVVAFLLYRQDKRAAQNGSWRTRERALHLADLLGGWPGGLLAQGRFRHKTRKVGFQLVFWATVALHCAALAWVLGAGDVVESVVGADTSQSST